jgi:hypothetical protein
VPGAPLRGARLQHGAAEGVRAVAGTMAGLARRSAGRRLLVATVLLLALTTCSVTPPREVGGPLTAAPVAVVALPEAAEEPPEPAPALRPPAGVEDRDGLVPPAEVRRPEEAEPAAQSEASTPSSGDGALDGQPDEVAPAEAGTPSEAAPAPPPAPPTLPPTAPTPAASAPAPAPPEPSGIRITRLGIAGPLTPVGLHADRTLVVPEDERFAGWYTGAPRPGQRGPAVIAGHNAWNGRSGVFWRLREVVPGDRIEITHDSGAVVTFVVDRVEQHPKAAFPTQRVYGNTDGAELRVITCGGAFDQRRRSHVDNIVVFASRVP